RPRLASLSLPNRNNISLRPTTTLTSTIDNAIRTAHKFSQNNANLYLAQHRRECQYTQRAIRPNARPSSIVQRGTTSMSQKARIAVIGTGWWATYAHIPALKNNPQAEIV